MDIIQSLAIATRSLQWAAREEIAPPMPDYVSSSVSAGSGNALLGFQMRSFEEVKEWAVYLNVEFDYSETETTGYRGNTEPVMVGFANARYEFTDAEFGLVRLHVYHNQLILPPPAETLFDTEPATAETGPTE